MNDDQLYQEALEKIAKHTWLSPDEVARRIKDVRATLLKKTVNCLTAFEWQNWLADSLPKERQQHLNSCVFCTKVSKVQLR